MPAFARTAADTLEVRRVEVAVPVAGPDEVLVAIEAFGVGVHDRYFIPATARFPYVIGIEGVGRVVSSTAPDGPGAPGLRVAFVSSQQPQGATWPPWAVVQRDALVAGPEALPSAEAAALPVAGRTALQALADLDLARGETLFIAGASGAIGTLAVQLAARRGVRVAASASPPNHAYLRSLGAELAVDYRDTAWPRAVQGWAGHGVDAALAIQPGTGASSITAVRDGGRVVTVSGDAAQVPAERDISVRQMGQPQGGPAALQQLLEDAAAGRLRVVTQPPFAFGDALQALASTETRHARGKVVVCLPR